MKMKRIQTRQRCFQKQYNAFKNNSNKRGSAYSLIPNKNHNLCDLCARPHVRRTRLYCNDVQFSTASPRTVRFRSPPHLGHRVEQKVVGAYFFDGVWNRPRQFPFFNFITVFLGGYQYGDDDNLKQRNIRVFMYGIQFLFYYSKQLYSVL